MVKRIQKGWLKDYSEAFKEVRTETEKSAAEIKQGVEVSYIEALTIAAELVLKVSESSIGRLILTVVVNLIATIVVERVDTVFVGAVL